MTDIIDPGRKARKDAKKASDAQELLIAQQKQKEDLRLAESKSEVSKRQGLIQRQGGRSLLIKTSPQGVQKLGA